MNLEVVTPQKKTSWASLISDIGIVGEDNGKPFPPEKLKQMRSLISAVIHKDFPSRTYKARHEIKEGKQVTWIWLDEDSSQEKDGNENQSDIPA